MDDPDLAPLDPDLSALIAEERARPRPPDETLDAVLARAAQLGGSPPRGGGAPPAAPGAGLKAISLFAVTGLLVAGAGALAARRTETLRPLQITVPSISIEAEQGRSGDVKPPPIEGEKVDLELRDEAVAPRPKPTSEGGVDPGNKLREELRLISEARSALQRGERARARELLEQHRTRFPAGQLAPERETLSRRAMGDGRGEGAE